MTHLTDEALSDILVTALEGGSNYWMDDTEVCRNLTGAMTGCVGNMQYTCFAGETNIDDKGWTPFSITMESIRTTLDWIQKNDWIPLHIRLMAKGIWDDPDYDYDAGDADNIIQYAIFKELVFG